MQKLALLKQPLSKTFRNDPNPKAPSDTPHMNFYCVSEPKIPWNVLLKLSGKKGSRTFTVGAKIPLKSNSGLAHNHKKLKF